MAHSIFWSHALVRAAIIDLDDTLGDVVAINATLAEPASSRSTKRSSNARWARARST
jgi:hypothetical protein